MPVAEVIKTTGATSISTLNAGTGSTKAGQLVFKTALIGLLDFYGIEWSDAWEDVVPLMHSEYYWLSMGELKHFLTRAKTGKFGKIYGKFSPSVLMEWLGEYSGIALRERAEVFANKRAEPEEDEESTYVETDRIKAAFLEFGEQWQQRITRDEQERALKRAKEREEEAFKMMDQILRYAEANNIDLSEYQNTYLGQKSKSHD